MLCLIQKFKNNSNINKNGKEKIKKDQGSQKWKSVINLNSVKFEEEVKICPLCGKPYKGWGNNPSPLEMDMVCDECNLNVIIPLRFGIDITSIQKNEEI